MQDQQTRLDNLAKEINTFIDEYEYYLHSDRNQKLKPSIDQYIKELDSLTQAINETKKQQRAKVFLLRAKLLDLLPQYEKSAEEYLNKSIKLNPQDGECWNTLGHVLWKKKDYEGSRKALEMAVENCGKNKVSLRFQSMLLRSIGDNEQRKENVLKSVDIAKQALMLDLKDGQSWYLVGNAWLINFFVNYKKIAELETAIKAYNEAEKYLKYANPDLHVNRGTAYKYMEDYEQALKDFEAANAIDKTEQTEQNITQIKEHIERCRHLLDEAKTIKPKKLSTLIKSIPLESPGKKIYPFKDLKAGLNKGCYLATKVIAVLSKKNDVPASFVVVDSAGNFGCISIYNASNNIYDEVRQGADVIIAQPMLKTIKFVEFSYNCVQVFELNKILVNDVAIIDKFVPNVLVNQTFEK